MMTIDSKGFTLVEVILAIVILGIAIPALISSVSFMAARQVNTMGTTIAADLALERMEQVIGDKLNPAIGFANINTAGRYTDETPMAAPFNTYNRKVRMICVAPTDLNTSVGCPTDYIQVQVTVSAVGVGPSVPDAVLYTVMTNH